MRLHLLLRIEQAEVSRFDLQTVDTYKKGILCAPEGDGV